MRYQLRLLPVGLLFALLSFVCPVFAEEGPEKARADGQPDEKARLDDAAAIARMLNDRYSPSAEPTTQIFEKLTSLDAELSEDNRRRIERNRFKTFVWSKFNFQWQPTVYLRCPGRQGEIFLVKFDNAGKMLSCETDLDKSASHYATDHYVALFHVSDYLRRFKAPPESRPFMKLEVAFGDPPPGWGGPPPFEVRKENRGPFFVIERREGEFVLKRKDGVPWCSGRFAADVPTGEWQIYAPDGKPAERWTFRDGLLEKTPQPPAERITYEGDLGADDFALTMVQGSPPPATGPPRTYVRVSAGGKCEIQFGQWKASFRLSKEQQRTLRDLVRAIDIPSLTKKTYSDPNVHDGGWLDLSLRAKGVEKTVRYYNWYPRPVRDLANFFAADVFPQYPLEFLGAAHSKDWWQQDRQNFLDDEK